MRVKRLIQAAVVATTLIIGVIAVAIGATQTSWFRNWFRGYITREAHQYLNGELSIGRLNGNLFFGVELEDVGIALNGRPVVSVKDIRLQYNALRFISKRIAIQSLVIDHPVVYLTREGDTWSIARLVRKDEQQADRQGPALPIAVDRMDVQAGAIVFDQPFATAGVIVPTRFDDVDLRMAFSYAPVEYRIDVAHASFRASHPSLNLTDFSGAVSVHDDAIEVAKLALRTSQSSVRAEGSILHYTTNPVISMQMTADALSLPEFAQVVPAVAGIPLQPSLNAKVEGPLDRLAANFAIGSTAGEVKGNVVADLALPEQSIQGEVSLSHLNVAPVVAQANLKTDLTAILKADVHAASLADLDTWRGTIAITTPRVTGLGYAVDRLQARANVMGRSARLEGTVDAYRAAASFQGRVAFDHPPQPRFDVRGNLRHVNLAALPRQLKLPIAVTNLNTSYHVTGTGTEQIRGDLRLADSDIAGARLAAASTVSVSMKTQPRQPSQIDYQADVTAANVDLQRVGQEFGVRPLDDDRYRTRLNAHVTATGRGTSPASMQAALCGELTDSTVLGGQVPQLAFEATMDRDAVHLTAMGSLEHLDPGAASGRAQLKGMVAGTFDVDATLTNLSAGVDLDHLDGTAKVSLSPSTVGGLEIERASVDAQYQQQVLAIRTLDALGSDLRLQGSGTVDLTTNGASNLKVHAESSNLETIGKLVDQPLKGIATVDATVTGNRSNVRASGTLTAGELNAAGVDALTVASDFTVDVPNLSAADAAVSATTKANFVTIGGQQINELAATTHYAQSQLDLDVTAKQAERTMNARGRVMLHPGEQELRLTHLDLAQQQLQWQLAPGTEATVRYGGGFTTVKGLQLVSGEQQITADGTFGTSDAAHEPLSITARNLNLSNVDAVLLRPPQFSGVLNASATIEGTAAAPQAKAEFAVTSGGFRNFHYESLKGSASFNGSGLTVDSELRQNPTASLQVNGYIPAAALRAPAAGTEVSPDDGFDLHVRSTPVDLGIVQGFTTALTNVTGTAQATIDVTGPADDPRPRGTIVLDNGGFAVEATGAAYTGLTGRIDLQDDRVHIAELNLYDTSNATLSLTGDIPIRRALTGDVNLQITARDFKVLNNKMGDLRIDSDLTVAGELRAPRIEGELAVSTGRINLDPLLATTGGGGYSTKPTEFATPAPTPSTSAAPTKNLAPGAAGIQLNVHITAPNALVVKSDNLQTGSSPIGLGALNITLGGDLRATKAPNQQIRLVGTVNAVRGSYQFQGRQFTILRDGVVRFDGDPIDQLNPALDLKTQRIIQGVEANADIRGTLQRPRIELTSVPPLERGDILSLIVFNQPVNQLGEGQQISLNQRAEQLALGSIAGQLSKSLGSLLNVSEFQIQAAPESGAAAQLTIGQQVSQRLFVKLEQGVGNVSTTNAVLEYEVKDWLRLQTNLLQAAAAQQALFDAVRDSGFDLIFLFTR